MQAIHTSGYSKNGFMGSSDRYEDADVIIAGAPMDFTCSFKPGARFGPGRIRAVSVALEEYSLYQHASLEDSSYFDYGDIEMTPGDVMSSLESVGKCAEGIVKDKKIPLFVGGEHLISVPVIREVFKKYGDELVLVQFDAHADLRNDYMGLKFSHATTIRRVLDFMPGNQIYQLGIRSVTREEFIYASENTNMFEFKVNEPLKNIICKTAGKPLYVTIDIDVVDPSHASGTGTPEPGGISSSELIEAVCMLKDTNLVGADVVEVSPEYDTSDRTAILAAKLIREIIIGICKRKHDERQKC